MELGLRLSQKQTLKLVMTPRLQQALKLLQMPALELSQHIKQELLTNPLLEIDEDSEEGVATSDGAEEEGVSQEPSSEAVSPDESEFKADEKSIDWEDYFEDGFAYGDEGRNEREETEFYERTPIGRVTLADSLEAQLRLLGLAEEISRIAEYLIGCLDDNGFLTASVEDVAAELAVSPEAVEEALRALQSLDPPGVGARDLTESLLIQLAILGREDSLAARIVAEHFEAFKRKQYQEIAKVLGVTAADVQDAAREIAALNPRPGAQLALEDARYIVPDLVVEKVEGRYEIYLNEGSLPRLRVSRKYREILERGKNAKNSAAREAAAGGKAEAPRTGAPANGVGGQPSARGKSEYEFVQEKLRSANWLIQTIEQRRRTMVRVMEAIVEAQYEFFEKGPQALKPLTLQDVAERIGMHESTVSRVTTNKYAQTPQGLLPLKHFFSSGLGTESGESVSSKMAMGRIKQLVAEEDRKKPLSDQRIAEILRSEGLIVARRTVAKYREKMGILAARYRKEF